MREKDRRERKRERGRRENRERRREGERGREREIEQSELAPSVSEKCPCDAAKRKHQSSLVLAQDGRLRRFPCESL
jgi:hypothetical protein